MVSNYQPPEEASIETIRALQRLYGHEADFAFKKPLVLLGVTLELPEALPQPKEDDGGEQADSASVSGRSNTQT